MDEWTHVRIRRSTHAMLLEMMRRRSRSADLAQMRQWWDGEAGPTADSMVRWLVLHVQRDRERAGAARRRSRERRAAELLATAFDVARQED